MINRTVPGDSETTRPTPEFDARAQVGEEQLRTKSGEGLVLAG